MFIQKSLIKLPVTLLLISLFLYSCVQTKSLVKRSYAFYTEKMPGTVQTDENGNPRQVKPDTIMVVYVETTTKLIAWDTAWKNNRMYKIIPRLIDSTHAEAGFEKSSKESIMIETDPDHFLYQLYLQPLNINRFPPKSIDNNQILLKASYKGKTLFSKTGKLIQLETYPSV